MDLKTKNHFPYFNFLKIKKPWIRDWKRKKSNIKEREYLLKILVLVFNISISYIYILIRGRDGFLGFGTVLGCFEAGTNGTRTGQSGTCPESVPAAIWGFI